MDNATYGSLPGIGSLQQTAEKVIVWGRDADLLYLNSLVIDSTAVDAANTPTTTLRAGLIMAKQTADGNLYALDPDTNDGTEVYAGVLLRDLAMLDGAGVAEDKYGHLLRRGPVKASELLIQGSALVGHAAEYLVRRMMILAGCEFDDDIMGVHRGVVYTNKLVTGTTHTVTAADNGKRFFYDNVAAVAVTLPAIKAGLVYEFVRSANEEIVISSAAGDDMIVGNDLSADSLTFTTNNEQIGAAVRIEGVYAGTTLKWLASIIHAPFSTNSGTGLTMAIGT